ncbi:nucleoside diphosphate kinase [Thecamonas trahens ATCC 50062]|uniref:Nucleoside diphosphate kinase n=1 Tax=Thecamonas trahens ATCC 50062 TaxID=461836 RepID=A0A0L0DWI2_THETB|nr:nucleoside diphosphate kinase [Thecamonas trahens ATCC 50062]KNC56446.1 nucleoside diphosphate kinase [Thecamonas trahens ATCC 50062]|eukprot:XP_013760958.1 nucleoside diphosphate kinase [Thecamonas trahens ATCC 50062]
MLTSLAQVIPAVVPRVAPNYFAHTFGLLKPDLVAATPRAAAVVRALAAPDSPLRIVALSHREVDPQLADAFYADHAGKFFAPRLTASICSGPLVAMVLESVPASGEHAAGSIDVSAIEAWRSLIGPTKVNSARCALPGTLRGLYSTSDTRNAFHGADAHAAVLAEAELFFPGLLAAAPRPARE